MLDTGELERLRKRVRDIEQKAMTLQDMPEKGIVDAAMIAMLLKELCETKKALGMTDTN